MFSRFFINRPIFATVIAIIMILAGVITVKTLPIAQYPNITPPTVMVSATYPGADAKTVAETVGVPIEESVNGVEGMMYMSSNSGSDGSYSLTITFENGVNLDDATVKVQNLINQAEPGLPSAVTAQGIDVMSKSTSILLFIALEGDDRYDALYLTNYAQLHIVDAIRRLPGVGGATAFGGGDYSMRIWLKPNRMQSHGISPDDVIAAIEAQNIEVSAGAIGAPPTATPFSFQYTLTSQGRLTSAEEFSKIILRKDSNGGILRLRDVAEIELGSNSYSMQSRVSGQPAGLIGIYQRPDANALDVAHAVEKELKSLEPYFPPGVHYRVLMNTTAYITASVDEVLVTFLETTLIVMIVILFFLQSWRAVVIPMITIPVSLIATFAVMKLLGFTLNTLTLFGLVLAIAIVVDDAIVVVENCERWVQSGEKSPREAAIQAMKELQGPIIGEVLVLMSVFIPTAFISGITGELYKQFALTIAVSTAFSGFNALTFTPAMCALFLRKKSNSGSKSYAFRLFNAGWAKWAALYTAIISRFLKRPWVALSIYALLCIAAFYGFAKWPTSYLPEEDMGYCLVSVELPTGASLARTEKVVSTISDRILAIPEVEDVIAISGNSFVGGGAGSNFGSLFVMLKPWNQRKGKAESVDAVIAKIDMACADLQEAVTFAINPPAIPGLGLTSGLTMQLLDINSQGPVEMQKALEAIKIAAKDDGRIASIQSMYEGIVPQYRINFDRDKIELLGIDLKDVYSALNSYIGGTYVNDFVKFGNVYHVTIEADAASRNSASNILTLSVSNSNGEMVPFSAFATMEPTMGSPTISRYNMYETASLTATPAKGVSTSEGLAAMEQIVSRAAGSNYSYAWSGEAYQESQSGTTVSTVLIFALIATILVLAAQYESWNNPIAVVMTMPTAILGTIIGCLLLSQSISIYTQIGIILLLGLSAKNAILIVEYAIDYRRQGLPLRQAALDAGKVRLRPIMMTALAFIFGVMPMLFATGAGANSRLSLGTAVVFGMAINAIIGTIFVPNFWLLLQSPSQPRS
jgi:hydrophobe/amphiphile efflux-1 (HAE1) family protein